MYVVLFISSQQVEVEKFRQGPLEAEIMGVCCGGHDIQNQWRKMINSASLREKWLLRQFVCVTCVYVYYSSFCG